MTDFSRIFNRISIKVFADKLWWYTILAVVIKSILFVRYISDVASGLKYGYHHILGNLPTYFFIVGIFLSFAFLFSNRIKYFYLLTFNFLISLLLLIDLVYYRANNAMVSIQLLQGSNKLISIWDSIFSMLRVSDAFFIVDIAVLLIYIIIKGKEYRNSNKSKWVFIIIFCICIGMTFNDFFNYKNVSMIDTGITVIKESPMGYHIINIISYFNDGTSIKMNSQQKEEISQWLKRNEQYAKDSYATGNTYKGMMKNKNLIIIQTESLENFVIGKQVNGKEITPCLNKLLKNSLYFTNFYEQVNQGTSSDADLMINTSVYPVKEGSTFFLYPNTKYNSLPKILKKYKYESIGIHPDEGSYWNWKPALINMGFDKCIDRNNFIAEEEVGMGISDRCYLKQVASKIINQKYPYYSFIVTLTSHAPFNLPKEHRELNLEAELDESILGGYFESIHYTDKYIGVFLDTLEKEEILKDTLVVIYGDHEGPHQYYPAEVAKFSKKDIEWLKNDKKIPLIVYHPSIKGKKVETIGGQIDVLPTVCNLLGVDIEDYACTAMGRDLLCTNRNFAILRGNMYVGDNGDYCSFSMTGPRIADKIIRGNYFKNAY